MRIIPDSCTFWKYAKKSAAVVVCSFVIITFVFVFNLLYYVNIDCKHSLLLRHHARIIIGKIHVINMLCWFHYFLPCSVHSYCYLHYILLQHYYSVYVFVRCIQKCRVISSSKLFSHSLSFLYSFIIIIIICTVLANTYLHSTCVCLYSPASLS